VLEKLNIHISTPTPPPSRASTNSSWLATPHTLRQLHKQASSVKKLLNRRSQSPSQIAIQQLIKGCEMAMHSAALLTKENHDLRAANEKERQKRKQSRHQMTPNEGLSIQEARDLIQARNEQGGGASIDSSPLPLEPPKRAPPRCTNCFIVGHTRTRCPTRHTS
jgi:7-keto-8-aminopelargonate synthetase-like enzyme